MGEKQKETHLWENGEAQRGHNKNQENQQTVTKI